MKSGPPRTKPVAALVPKSMNGVYKAMRVAVRVSFAAVTLTAMLSCSQANVVSEQKWLSFRCPDGQTVMARFEPQDQFVNVRFAGRDLRLPHVISGSGATATARQPSGIEAEACLWK